MTEALGCEHVSKRYGETVANRDVSISVKKGSAHALVGENGAGKSTLMRILYGLERADEGQVRVGGEVVRPSVELSLERGVGMVHQHFMLVPTLTVAENVVLGREPRRGPLVDLKRAERELAAVAERYKLSVDPKRLVGDLSVGEAQRVEILKVLYRGARTLILDEPTAMLTPPEVDQLIAMLRGLVAGGDTVLIVTHKLGEVLALADEITVLRRGEVVDRRSTDGLSAASLGQALVGRSLPALPKRTRAIEAGERLRLADVAIDREDGTRALDGLSLTVAPGEILGVAGVEGNGQRELAAVAAGLLRPARGSVHMGGRDATRLDVAERHALGLGFVPEDRHEEGLLLDAPLWESYYLGREAAYGSSMVIPQALVVEDAAKKMATFDVRPADPWAHARGLSGGNQQKVLLLRELARRPTTLVCAQPTRGVDIGAIAEIHASLLALADEGAGILLVSAELDEIFAIADRVVVLYRGKLVLEQALGAGDDRDALRARIGGAMLGVAHT
ncbi:MAG: ABC transporter ATP-binding protein [Polyangia bacterium]